MRRAGSSARVRSGPRGPWQQEGQGERINPANKKGAKTELGRRHENPRRATPAWRRASRGNMGQRGRKAAGGVDRDRPQRCNED